MARPMPYPVAATSPGLSVADVASIIAAVAALLALGAAARTMYRKTIGRRADRYRRIARLGTGGRLSFFTSVLGEPPAMRQRVVKDDYVELLAPDDPKLDPELARAGISGRHVTKTFTVCTFIDRDYYVQTISDEDDSVLAFSVTTRSARFKPRFYGVPRPGRVERWRWQQRFGSRYRPLVDVTLGRTTFADLDSADPASFGPPHFIVSMGAHNHAYSEFSFFGNPGHYQTFVWTASDAARQGRFGDGTAVSEEIGGHEWPDPTAKPNRQPEWSSMPATQDFRRETVITTYTVVSAALWIENYPLGRFGPHENEVRTLP
jgi:hypothetical protein